MRLSRRDPLEFLLGRRRPRGSLGSLAAEDITDLVTTDEAEEGIGQGLLFEAADRLLASFRPPGGQETTDKEA